MAVQPDRPDIVVLDGIRAAACHAGFLADMFLVYAAWGGQAVTGGEGVSCWHNKHPLVVLQQFILIKVTGFAPIPVWHLHIFSLLRHSPNGIAVLRPARPQNYHIHKDDQLSVPPFYN